jgi:hypothetical protein
MNFVLRSKGLGVAALAVVACTSQAVVAYDNFGPGDTFTLNIANPIYADQILGNRFTALQGGVLDKVTVALSGLNNLTDTTVFALYTDVGGALGSQIVSWSVTPTAIFGNSYSPDVYSNANPLITLNAGDSYWLVATPGDPNSNNEWNRNSTGATGPITYSVNGGATWNYFSGDNNAFRVEVADAAVPGPAALAPFVLGLVAALRRKRR